MESSHGRRTRFGFFAEQPAAAGEEEEDQDRQPRRRASGGKRVLLPEDFQSTWQAMERETGWQLGVAFVPYAQLVVYRHVTLADARGSSHNGGVWVDIVGADGRPLRRNVGLLRWVCSVPLRQSIVGLLQGIFPGDGQPRQSDALPLRSKPSTRYLGGVAFASDGSMWAGIQLHGLRVEGNENDGRGDEIRCVFRRKAVDGNHSGRR